MKELTLTTDGACLGNPGPGGWAALLMHGDQEKLITGAEKDTTNNRMEVMAVIEGLAATKEACKIKVVSDSKYVVDAFRQGWLENWKRRNWKTAGGKDVSNQDLWKRLDSLVSQHEIEWTWVKGHSGDPDNERVDQAARDAALSLRDN